MAKLTAGTRIKATPDAVYTRVKLWAIGEKMEIVSEQPPGLLVLRATKPFRAEARVTFAIDGEYTDLALDVDAAVPMLLVPVVRPQAEKQFREALADLKKELES